MCISSTIHYPHPQADTFLMRKFKAACSDSDCFLQSMSMILCTTPTKVYIDMINKTLYLEVEATIINIYTVPIKP